MKPTVKRCLPALVAALILASMPACAGFFRYADMRGPIANPHIVERIAPRDPDIPAGIERMASAELFLVSTVVFFIFGIAFLLAWGIGEMFRAMYEDGRARDYPNAGYSDDTDPEQLPAAVAQTP